VGSLARRGWGAAALSTALNSITINVAVGLSIPAAFTGLAKPSVSGLLVPGADVVDVGPCLPRLTSVIRLAEVAAYVVLVVAVLAITQQQCEDAGLMPPVASPSAPFQAERRCDREAAPT
jgi:hypothetical protein